MAVPAATGDGWLGVLGALVAGDEGDRLARRHAGVAAANQALLGLVPVEVAGRVVRRPGRLGVAPDVVLRHRDQGGRPRHVAQAVAQEPASGARVLVATHDGGADRPVLDPAVASEGATQRQILVGRQVPELGHLASTRQPQHGRLPP